jgi:hypothetical protein
MASESEPLKENMKSSSHGSTRAAGTSVDGFRRYATIGFMNSVKIWGDRHQPKLRADVEKYSTPREVSTAKVKYFWWSWWMPK